MRRHISSTLTLISCALCILIIFGQPVSARDSSYDPPPKVCKTCKYLFFHHNYYVETKGVDGECKYYDILKAFEDNGFTVVSRIRPAGKPLAMFVDQGVRDIQTVLASGVPAERITVAGHSKGAVIALNIAAKLNQPKANFVIAAGCGIAPLSSAYPEFKDIKGNILSILASTDKLAKSCNMFFPDERGAATFKEVIIESSFGHRLFFTPTQDWVEPIINWLEQ